MYLHFYLCICRNFYKGSCFYSLTKNGLKSPIFRKNFRLVFNNRFNGGSSPYKKICFNTYRNHNGCRSTMEIEVVK